MSHLQKVYENALALMAKHENALDAEVEVDGTLYSLKEEFEYIKKIYDELVAGEADENINYFDTLQNFYYIYLMSLEK